MANVLLIEPDMRLAAVYQAALQAAGHTVWAGATAQMAISCADEQRPDVVVLELQMPRHNGVEFLYEFHSYADWQTVPVVLHTVVPAGEMVHMRQTMQKLLGVRAYLYKPQATLADLTQKVAEVLRAA